MYDNKKIDVIKNWLGSGSINIFGRPLAGKDCQGQRLAKLLEGTLISSGNILRNNIIPDDTKQAMDTGHIIPSDDFANIVLPYLSKESLADKPLILSSIGRWHGEEQSVINTIESSGHPLKAVIYLNVSNDDSTSRWQVREINSDRFNRKDDSEQALKTRFIEFTEKTQPVVDFYRKKGLLIEIDGKKTRDEVTRDIIDALTEHIER